MHKSKSISKCMRILNEYTHKRESWLFFAGFILLIILTVLMRFYYLNEISYGLHLDEAYNGLDAYRLVGKAPWKWPVFFTSNFGREPLLIYLTSLAQQLFGPTKLALRIVPAVISVLLTPALVWLGWEMAPHLSVHYRKNFALWSGVGVLSLLWAQMHARILVRGGLFLLLEVLILASFWRAWNTQKWTKWLGLAGFLTGLSFYTYLPARLLPLFFLLVAPFLFLETRQFRLRPWRGIALGLLITLLISWPLLSYFWEHPQDFLLRSEQVSILSSKENINYVEQVINVLGMAFVQGDSNLRMNYPRRPVLDIFTVAPFLLGLLIVMRRPIQYGAFSLLGLAFVMLLPTFLSVDPPNFGRAIGALPFFTLCIALGLERLSQWSGRVKKWLPKIVFFLSYCLLLGSALLTWQIYFIKLPQIPDRFYMWDEGPTRLAYHVASSDPNKRVYIGPGIQGLDHPTVRYLLLRQPSDRIHGFDGRTCLRVPTGEPAIYYFINNDFVRGPSLLHSYLPDSLEHDVIFDPWGNVWAKRIDQPANGRVVFPEMKPYPIILDDGIRLNGYWLSQSQLQAGQRLYVRLFWQATAKPSQDYTIFVHLIRTNSPEEVSMSTLLMGEDSKPGKGSCSTIDWLPGEVIVDEKELVLPASLDPNGVYYLEVGLYTLENGRRLNIPGSAENRILIGPLPTQ